MSALEWYAHKSLGDGIFWIQERFYESGNRANIWLVRGSEQDVVIDTGLGLRSLPEYLYSSGLLQDGGAKEDAGRRPLLAVATHVHFDHSGGLYQFDQVAVHRAEAEALARGDNFETVTWLSDSEVVRAPSPGWRARQFRVPAVQPTLILQDGNGPRGARAVAEGGAWGACAAGCSPPWLPWHRWGAAREQCVSLTLCWVNAGLCRAKALAAFSARRRALQLWLAPPPSILCRLQ